MKKFIAFSAFIFISLHFFSQSWQDVGGGTNNSSHGLLTWNGKLIDLGSFNNPCNRVAAWDGTSWECLDNGVGIVARAGTVWNGNLVVVGDFWNVQQPCTNCNGVAMWDGTQWTNIGAGFNNDVLCVTVWNGDLVVAGDFTQSNGVPCSRIAKWTGSVWEQIGPSDAFNNDIRAITEFEGELWIGGDFTNVGGCSACDRLVKWSGAAWIGGDSGVDIQGGVDNTVRVLYVNPYDGKLYMGGHFIDLNLDGVVNTDCKGVAVYDGSNWEPLGTGLNDYVRAIHEYNGNIVVGGYFTDAGGVSANRIAKWNQTTQTWSAMGLGFNGAGIDEYVKSATVWNGIFFAGGAYTVCESNSMDFIAQWYEVPLQIPTATINAEQTSLCTGGCFSFTDESTYGPTSWQWSFPGGSITSSTMQDPPPVCYSVAGNYTVTLQACNSNGCNTTTQDISVTTGSTVTVNSPTICSGSSTVLTADPSSSGGSFLWSPGGETTQSITVSPTSNTSYTVTYTNSGCGPVSATSNVTVNSVAPTVSVNSPTICSGASTVLTATPSTGGGTYLWYPGNATTQSITVSPTATQVYTVTYSLSGCSSSPTNTTVTVNPVPTVTVNNANICSGNSTSLTATPSSSGGTYLWSPGGQTTQSITVNPSSTTPYSVVYTLNGCASASATGTVTVNQTPTATVNNQSICTSGSATLTATPSVSGGTYLWSPDSQTTQSINVSPSSTATYSVVYTLNGCNSPSASGIVTVNTTPTVTVNNPTICSGNSTVLTATSSTSGGSYLWSPGGQTTQSITVNPSSTTPYSVVYTLNGCASASATGTVTVNQTPTATVNNQTICTSGSTTLTATPSISGGTYLWAPDSQTTQSITVSPTSTESYSVIYTLNGCNSPSSTGTVTVNSTPTVAVNSSTICSGSSANLTATPSVSGGTYLWSPDGQITQSISINPSSTTTYSVIYTLNGCASASASGTVNVNQTPTVTVNNETICSGNSTNLSATPSVSGGSYLWSPGGELTQSITVNPVSTTPYSVVYTQGGCSSSSATGTVTVNPTPSLSVNSPTICTGGTGAILTATPSTTGGTYLWSPDSQTTQSINVNPASNASYSVVYTLNGCESNTATSNVVVNTTPTVNTLTTGSNTICNGENIIIDAIVFPGGGSFLWSPNGETTSSINDSPTITTMYSVQYTLNGCSEIAFHQIDVQDLPIVSVNDASTCSGEEVILTATSNPIGGTFLWSPDNQTDPSITVSPTSNATYTVVYTYNGCSNSASSNVSVQSNPILTVSQNQNILTADQTGATYQWLDCLNGNSIVSGETSQIYTALVNGEYSVEINLNGCLDTSDCQLVDMISLDENHSNGLLILSPNPVTDLLTISFENVKIGSNLEMTDELGKIILKMKINSEQQILDLKGIAPGIYYINIENIEKVNKIIKL